MQENAIHIGKQDVIWNYAATLLRIGLGVIILPFIIHFFSKDTVAVWNIFSIVIGLTGMFDFGFNPSFSRNISYVMSGVKCLQTKGFQSEVGNIIDYGLLKGIIYAMKWFYTRVALLILGLLVTVGTYYIYLVLQDYSDSKSEVYISWFILCAVNAYSLYTYWYDALMQGMGLIKCSKQIQVLSNVIYLVVAICMIFLKFNLIAIVSAQALMVVIKRWLSYNAIFSPTFKRSLKNAIPNSQKKIIKNIFPNAIRLGLTGIGSFFVTRSSVLIGSLYLSLDVMASYGVTFQIVTLISSVAAVYFSTYQPKIAQQRVYKNKKSIIKLFVRGNIMLLLVFLFCGIILVLWGADIFLLIGSKTPLMPRNFLIVTLVIYCLEAIHTLSASLLLTKNEVPFFKASLISGAATLLFLFIFLKFTSFGVWGLIIAPGIVQLAYQNWKWPLEAIKDLKE
jgi:O-antigen/teichoic acid export membrane protein